MSLGARPIVRISAPGAGPATPARPIGAVLFDFGDTLVRFSHIDKRALFERAAWRTYRLWARRQRRMPGFRRYYLHQAFAMRWAFCKTTILGRELDALKYMQRACTKLWLEAPREFFDELMWQWYKPIVEAATLEPGAEQVLGHLHAAGCRVGLVSNTFLPAFVMDRHLARLGLLELLPVRVYSSDLRYRKPDHRL
jgi:FMN phosphatase YigB (HAD superfamily)